MIPIMQRVDDFLIDRVFQKIADALHRVASCFAIGAFFMTGFAIVHFSFWGWSFIHVGVSPELILPVIGLAMALIWVPPRVKKAIRLEREWNEGNDVLPNERPAFISQRVFFLLFLPFDWLLLVADVNLGNVVSAAADLSWSMLCTGLYFLACAPKRPRRQRQAQYAQAFGGTR